jgi:hypothetical protein
VVSDGCAVDQATSTVIVYAAPSAGEDGSIAVCLNEPFDLLMGLGGNVDLGGTWYNPSNQAMGSNLDTSSNLGGQYNYDYVVTSTVCANDTSNVIVIVDGSCDYTASINELSAQWEIYPNPTSTIISVANHSGLKVLDLEVLDINGKVILTSKSVHQVQNDIDVTQLQTGMYIVRMKFEDQTVSKRFIKQ